MSLYCREKRSADRFDSYGRSLTTEESTPRSIDGKSFGDSRVLMIRMDRVRQLLQAFVNERHPAIVLDSGRQSTCE